jgi:hypothetical protein
MKTEKRIQKMIRENLRHLRAKSLNKNSRRRFLTWAAVEMQA